MTVAEAAQLIAVCIASAGAIVIGIVKVFKPKDTNGRKKNSVPPVDHGPCNASVDKLTDAITEDREARSREHAEDIREWRAFRELFVQWMAREEGRRDAMRTTAEHRVVGG